jgi:hypothetical protein
MALWDQQKRIDEMVAGYAGRGISPPTRLERFVFLNDWIERAKEATSGGGGMVGSLKTRMDEAELEGLSLEERTLRKALQPFFKFINMSIEHDVYG